MIPVLTPVEMRAADARTIAAGTPEPVLMDRAGRAVAWRVRHVLGGTYGRRVAVICGPGNNGGDGRVVAAALRAWGARVEVIDLAALDATDGVDANVRRSMARADAIVDAMYGTGMRGALDGAAAELAGIAEHLDALVVAVDIPSGVDGLTGAVNGPAVRADHTITFAAPKSGLWFHPGRALAGTVTIADIGIDLGLEADRTVVVEDRDVAEWIPARPATTHKWRAGVLVIGGSNGMTGAPMLVGHAALRLGAGIVWAALPGRAAESASGTEVITYVVPDDGSGNLNAAGAESVLALAGRFRAVVLGPGLGRAEETAAAVRMLIGKLDVPLVLDADGLTALEGVANLLRTRSAPTVLTPHDGEFLRLTGAAPGADRVAATRELAAATNAVVLLKGPTTVVAGPDGRVRLNPTGGPALATAGSGDVLSGMIGAFCARGMKGFDATAVGAFVHGRAAEPDRHTGLIAGDLPARAAAALCQIVEHPAPEARMPSSTSLQSIMSSEVAVLRPDQTLAEGAELLADRGIGAAPVVDDAGVVVGLLRDEDLLATEARLHVPTTIAILGVDFTLPSQVRRYDEELRQAIASTVGGAMETEFPHLGADASIEDAATLMHESDVTHVVILDAGKPVGIVARGDLVRFLARSS